MSDNRPIHTIRRGSIVAAIFVNTANTERGQQEFFSTQLSRIYKQSDDQPDWSRSHSYSPKHLHLVAKVAGLAEDWIFEETERRRQAKRAS